MNFKRLRQYIVANSLHKISNELLGELVRMGNLDFVLSSHASLNSPRKVDKAINDDLVLSYSFIKQYYVVVILLRCQCAHFL